MMEILASRYEASSKSYFTQIAIPQLDAATVDKVKGELEHYLISFQ